VDWSGSAQAGKKIWAADVAFRRTGARLVRLWQPFLGLDAAGVADCFSDWLTAQEFDMAGLDFCFGLSSEHRVPGLPAGGPAALGPWLSRFARPEDFKRALGKERKRETDRLMRAPFAPTNLRMFRQTYWGLRALKGARLPIPPWDVPARRAVVEVLPAHVVSVLCRGCRYKGATPQARSQRQRLLAIMVRDCRLGTSRQDEEIMLDDTEGDVLDAVLATVAAGAAWQGGLGGVPLQAAASGEGWIYSIP
jgi:hypothetical protein